MAQDFQRPTILMTRGSTPAQSNAMAPPALSARALMLRGCKPRLFPIAEQEVQSAAVNKDEVTRVGTPSAKAVQTGVSAGALTERRWQMRRIKARTGDKSTEEALLASQFHCVCYSSEFQTEDWLQLWPKLGFGGSDHIKGPVGVTTEMS